MLVIALVFFNAVWVCYLWSGLILIFMKAFRPDRKVTVFNTVWKWSKWPAFVSLFANPVLTILTSEHIYWWDYFTWAVNVWLWYSYRDAGDDDLTRKMKEKLSEMVTEVQGRLVVVRTA